MSEKPAIARFEMLFSKYDRELRRFLGRYLPNKSDVEDCAQEVFMSMWKQESKDILREDRRGYLFTTAWNVVRAFWRKDRSRRGQFHLELSENLDDVHVIEFEKAIEYEKNLADREILRIIERQLDKLPTSVKDVFLLHHVEQMTFEQIAEHLDISTRTVERRMARALECFRSGLPDVAGSESQ